MRQALSKKNVLKIRARTGLPVIAASARGGEDHIKHLYLEDGSVRVLYPDGTVTPSKFDRHEVRSVLGDAK